MAAWPAGTRLILRKERPHPGAQLTFTDTDGHRITGFFTDTGDGVIPGQLAGLELRHRHTRPRGRPGSAGNQRHRESQLTLQRVRRQRGLARNHPAQPIWSPATNSSASPTTPSWPGREIETFRYRVLHVAARITRGARQDPAAHRCHLALGNRRSPPPGPASAPASTGTPRSWHCPDEMKDPTGLGKARPMGATPDDLSHPHATASIINRPEPGSHAFHQAACRIEASAHISTRQHRKPQINCLPLCSRRKVAQVRRRHWFLHFVSGIAVRSERSYPLPVRCADQFETFKWRAEDPLSQLRCARQGNTLGPIAPPAGCRSGIEICYLRPGEVCTYVEMPAESENLGANRCEADVTAFNASTYARRRDTHSVISDSYEG